MSTKNLARTVIEGGRRGHSKYLRRRSLRYWRRDSNRLCDGLVSGRVEWDEAIIPWRERYYEDIEHADRTNPCERFLISRAGRPWNDVRSEICRRFDRRTLAGRHVTEEHLLNRVEQNIWEIWGYYSWKLYGGPKFWIDERGVLRHNPRRKH